MRSIISFFRGKPRNAGRHPAASSRWAMDGGAFAAQPMTLPREAAAVTAPRRRPAPAPAAEQDAPPAMAQNQGYLAAHGVEKSFAGRKVVKGASLYVRRGEAVGLLGPNGAGKTTVFYMITGLIKADRGRIELDGHDVTGFPMYQRARLGIGYLPQEASIFRGLNVEDNIRAVLEVVEPNRQRRERRSGSPARRIRHHAPAQDTVYRALRRRAPALRDRPRAGLTAELHAARRALCRHRSRSRSGDIQAAGAASDQSRHRRADHRPQCARNAGPDRPGLYFYSGQVLMEGRADDIVNNPDVRRLYLGEDFEL